MLRQSSSIRQVKGSVGVIHDITEMRNLMKELDRARTIIRKLESTYTFDDIYGNSADIEISIEQAKLAAQNRCTCLASRRSGNEEKNCLHMQFIVEVNGSLINSSGLIVRN